MVAPKLEILVEKPWGHERIIEKNNLYVVKELYIKAGHRLSLQYHEKKVEHVTVFEGKALLTLQDGLSSVQDAPMRKFHPYLILPGARHRFTADEKTDVRMVEVSTPQLDDVYRIEDDYGRAKE